MTVFTAMVQSCNLKGIKKKKMADFGNWVKPRTFQHFLLCVFDSEKNGNVNYITNTWEVMEIPDLEEL